MSGQYTSSVIDPLLGSIPASRLQFYLDAGAKDRVNADDGRTSIPHHHLNTPTLQFIEATAITLEHQGSPLTLNSMYVPPERGYNTRPSLEQDLRVLLPLGHRVLVCGDFNARHKSWDCNQGNRFVKKLYEFAMQDDLTIASPPYPTTFYEIGSYNN